MVWAASQGLAVWTTPEGPADKCRIEPTEEKSPEVEKQTTSPLAAKFLRERYPAEKQPAGPPAVECLRGICPAEKHLVETCPNHLTAA